MGDALYWSEGRPDEGGRTVIVKCDRGNDKTDVISPPFNARSRVHEYGGGEFSVWNDTVFFVNNGDQDIYEIVGDGAPQRLTQLADWRFTDMCYDEVRGQLIAVAERHDEGARLPVNLLVAVSLSGATRGTVSIIAEGRDFYATPRLSLDGERLAYLAWDLPHMPWEAAELWLVEPDEHGSFPSGEKVAGGDGSCVFQPEWTRDGRLIFIWDKSGWGNLSIMSSDGDGYDVSALCSDDAEYGHPQWVFGMRSYALVDDNQLIVRSFKKGALHLGLLNIVTREMTPIDIASAGIAGIDALVADATAAYMIASFHHMPPAIIRLPHDGKPLEIIQVSSDVSVLEGTVSVGEPVAFSSSGGRTCYGLYYAPANVDFSAPPNELPPMIVSAHGGPTAMADRGLKLKTQYWTSRGFAYFDVDYTGSFGYGTHYRRALDGHWGLSDVEDVVAGARALAEQGKADGQRLLISGSSAGGYTVLAALVDSDVFAAGAAYYGISDLFKLQAATHKFELGYIDTLMGTTSETTEDIFTARSPIYNAEKITSPVIFFQGSDDRVVPPEQSRKMADVLRERGVPVSYIEFSGEGHGFRDAANIETALAGEYAFYARILGLAVVDALPALEISNLD